MKKIIFSLSIILTVFLSTQSFSDEKTVSVKYKIYGKAKVTDGDTIVIKQWYPKEKIYKDHKVRLFGIDAPEKKQICKDKNNKDYNCGIVATKALRNFVGNENVLCIFDNWDIYKRVLGICGIPDIGIGGKDVFLYLNGFMVSNGYAVAYTKYSKKFEKNEDFAKKYKRGVWQGEFDMPWEWRRKNK